MVVKSKLVSDHLRDLGDIFEILRKFRLRLNASKCSFGVGSGKFLGYMVTHRVLKLALTRLELSIACSPLGTPRWSKSSPA